MKPRKINLNSFITTSIFTILILYVLILIQIYVVPNKFKVPIISLIGFSIIIIGILYFFLKIDSSNDIIIKIKIINENAIKNILMVLMIITIFIPSISFSDLIISWDQISFLNYLRAVVFLLGAGFIPGSCIFNLLLPESSIYKRLNVEPFFVKLTIYPILSLTYLGSLSLTLDFLGFTSFSIFLFLIFSFILLYIIDLFFKRKRKKILFEITELTISRYTLLILAIGLGIVIIALGTILSSQQFIITGDRWRGISPALLIGTGDFGKFLDIYTKYWSCVSYSLSALCGIPYINANVLLFSFLYLSITSSYLFAKSLLNNMDERFCVLTSIFIFLTFQITLYIFQFSYHSFAFFSFFLSLTLFFIVSKSDHLEDIKKGSHENKILLFLSSFFIVQCFMTYMITVLMGIILVFLYSLFSANFKLYFKNLLIFYGFVIVIFFIFDFITLFFFSLNALVFLSGFSTIPLVFFSEPSMMRMILAASLFYPIILSFYFLLIVMYKFSNIFITLIKKINLKIINILKRKYTTFLLFFFFDVLILICLLLANLDFTFGERLLLYNIKSALFSLKENFLIFYLSTLLSAIGFVGMIGIFLSYNCFKENRKLFFFLLIWILIIIGLASSLIFLRWIRYPSSLISEIPENYIFYMRYWFSRTWYYSMIPLSIFASIGLIRFIQHLKLIHTRGWFKVKTYNNINFSVRLFLISLFLFLTFAKPITNVIYWDNFYSVNNEEAQIIGWTSKNLPKDSQILIDNNVIWRLKDVIQNDVLFFQTYYYSVELRNAINNYKLGDEDLYKWHENTSNFGDIKLVLEKDNRSNVINMYDKSTSGDIRMIKNFTEPQINGTIAFSLKIESEEDENAGIVIKLFGNDSSEGIDFYLNYGNHYFYNDSINNYDLMTNNYELNEWNYYVINYNCSSNYWNVYINGVQIYGYFGDLQFKMKGDPLNFSRVLISTTTSANDYKVYFDDFVYSWEPNNLDNDIYNRILVNDNTKLIYYLNSEKINYFIIYRYSLSNYEEIIDYFYNETLYEYGDISIYKSINF